MHLTDCFMELFAYVTHFLKSVAAKQPSHEQVHRSVLRLLALSESRVGQGQFTKEDFDQAKFAVCAWVDEMLLSSSWDQKHLWLGEKLQKSFLTSDAGVEFFERLNALGLHQREAREVYYLCLVLGFTGKYCGPGDEYQLEQVRTAQLKLLVGSSVGLPSLERTELFPDAWPAEAPVPVQQRQAARFSSLAAASIGAPAVLFAILFLVYRFTLSGVGENFLRTVPY